MAKVSSPLFGREAHGKLGKTLVYSKWKGINVVKIKKDPSNPQTSAQTAQRTSYGKAVEKYREAPFETQDLEALERWAKQEGLNITAYNMFVKEGVRVLNTENPIAAYYNFYITEDLSGYPEAHISVVESIGGGAKVRWSEDMRDWSNWKNMSWTGSEWYESFGNLSMPVPFFVQVAFGEGEHKTGYYREVATWQ